MYVWTLEPEKFEEFDSKVHCLYSEYSFLLLIVLKSRYAANLYTSYCNYECYY